MHLMKSSVTAFNFFQNVGSGSGPDKGLRISVVMVDVSLDGIGQVFDAAKHSPAQAVDGEVAEEAFDHIEPGSACRREMKVETRVALLPRLHFFMLMSGVIVADEVGVFAGRRAFGNQAQETQPFLM